MESARNSTLLAGLLLVMAAVGQAAAAPPGAAAPSRSLAPEQGPRPSAQAPPTSSPPGARTSPAGASGPAGLAAAAIGGGKCPRPGAARQPICVDAASSNVDYKTDTIVFKNITVTQGDIKVRAQKARATGLNVQNSEWTFEGNVRIDAPPRGSLRSDAATVEVRNDRIARATVSGNPAQFEQQRGALGIARGHADQIIYDVGGGTVSLVKDAWLSYGRNDEMSAPMLVYNIRQQKVQATAKGSSQRVHITITPQPPPRKAKPTPPARGVPPGPPGSRRHPRPPGAVRPQGHP
jgi:lipopolysaccharide transport protein LptA